MSLLTSTQSSACAIPSAVCSLLHNRRASADGRSQLPGPTIVSVDSSQPAVNRALRLLHHDRNPVIVVCEHHGRLLTPRSGERHRCCRRDIAFVLSRRRTGSGVLLHPLSLVPRQGWGTDRSLSLSAPCSSCYSICSEQVESTPNSSSRGASSRMGSMNERTERLALTTTLATTWFAEPVAREQSVRSRTRTLSRCDSVDGAVRWT